MMTRAQVAELLTTAALVHDREITEPEVNLWHQIIGELEPAAAMAALIEHLTESPYPPKPADIVSRVRRTKARRREVEGIHPPPPAGQRWAVDVIEADDIKELTE